jgi:hypothetical protein
MDDQDTVSPYLRRPLRSLGEVLADKATRSARNAAKFAEARERRRVSAEQPGFTGRRLRLVWDRDRILGGEP